MTAPLHVIAGAGQIGPLIAQRLIARGLRVRILRRGAFAHGVPEGAESVRADVSDPAQAAEALRGASVVYHCANPRYYRWAEELVPLARGIVHGAAKAGARLVALDNLYMYEVPADGRLAEDTPVRPCSKKGALRAEAAEVMLAADRAGDVPVAIGRASDFVGPGMTNSVLGERFWRRLLAGKPVEVLGDVDQPHTYSYGPDVADGLVTLALGEARGLWHLPALPAEPTRAWIERFAAAVGVAPRTTELTPLKLRLAGLFLPEARELPEMLYQWRGPFALDDARFRAAWDAAPTPVDEVLRATLAWARASYGAGRAAA